MMAHKMTSDRQTNQPHFTFKTQLGTETQTCNFPTVKLEYSPSKDGLSPDKDAADTYDSMLDLYSLNHLIKEFVERKQTFDRLQSKQENISRLSNSLNSSELSKSNVSLPPRPKLTEFILLLEEKVKEINELYKDSKMQF